MKVPIRRRKAGASTSDCVNASYDRGDGGLDYYQGVVVGAQTIGERALDPATRQRAGKTLDLLDGDDYLAYTRGFVERGERLCGEGWRYADIVSVLTAATEVLNPASYLEIGVRRGRSMATVASRAPKCSIIGIDLWQADYAGMENPGVDWVRSQLQQVEFEGSLELLSGDSHELLPRLFAERPGLSFDLITVDGDHSPRGARRDLVDVLPRLKIGGVLVFDDTRHPAHPQLHQVWQRAVASERRYATWEFDEIGYGVALAVRRW